MKKAAYLEEVENAGVNVSPFEARRFRVFLVNYSEFRDYVARRLKSGESLEWVSGLVKDSDGYRDALQKGLTHDEIISDAKKELSDVLDLGDTGKNHRPEDLSKWMLQWVSESGLTSTRMVMNSHIATLRQQRAPIACYTDTRDRVMKAVKANGFSSADELINHMLDVTQGEGV